MYAQPVRVSFANPSHRNTDNQGLLVYRDNPSYGCIIPVPPAFNPTYSNPALTAQPGFQDNQRLIGTSARRVTVVQPAPVVVHGIFPPDYWGLSLFSLLCCSLPLGILAFIYSRRTRDATLNGDFITAEYYSKKSKIISICSIVLGLFCIVVATTIVLVL
ncbi:uncharacterized protein LOC116302476 isoform X2 [Actinia tenebrosa]|uniref:Uncharacterized protein LOC116302476 isoform X2 n=1 Tax=Actinia tenebrosa TaxID=6105 RepID=A0A6P8ILF1_ACTTE|nr:uncharacterized protein LOC116302476 isoform X2 [Actinia tenebrosa]